MKLIRRAGAVLVTLSRALVPFLAEAVDDPIARMNLAQVSRMMQQVLTLEDLRIARTRYGFPQSVRFGNGTQVFGTGSIHVGENTYFGQNCFLGSSPAPAQIEIGRGCAIRHNVHLRTESYQTDIAFEEALGGALVWQNIRVGDFVWIGANVFVQAGVTLGDNSIVAANSVVTCDVPPNSICAGAPAYLIRMKTGYQAAHEEA